MLYIDKVSEDMHGMAETSSTPMTQLSFETLHPGNAGLQKFQDDMG